MAGPWVAMVWTTTVNRTEGVKVKLNSALGDGTGV